MSLYFLQGKEEMAMKVFLSHSSVNKDLVSIVHKKLSAQNAWYDSVDIENGDSIPEKISEGLRIATHFVLFWDVHSAESNWVKAEMNAAFVLMMADRCKFMIFRLDKTPMPELLHPYKYEDIDKKDLQATANWITEHILLQDSPVAKLSCFINRMEEISAIEEAVRSSKKMVILHGILGIGKSALAEKALQWFYPNQAAQRIRLDFNQIPGMAELVVELSRKTKEEIPFAYSTLEEQKQNVRYFMEKIASLNHLLILANVKNWMAEDGTFGEDLGYIVSLIVETRMYESTVILTSSRYIDIQLSWAQSILQVPVKGMDDSHIAEIIKNNLLPSFHSDQEKNLQFAKRLYGYPLGGKLAAYKISNLGYDYFLTQPEKIKSLNVGLAKDLISYADISSSCKEYLEIVALAQSKLRNQEYAQAFPDLASKISKLADEAFFAGILNYDGDDGCYRLESLVEEYFYDLAFNSANRKQNCKDLEVFLLRELSTATNENKMRLLPVAIHILTLNGNLEGAMDLSHELVGTMVAAMWDQYNHMEFEEAETTADALLERDINNLDARYMKALCKTRADDHTSAKTLLEALMQDDPQHCAKYYYALGRSQKMQEHYAEAVQFQMLALKERARYLSAYRELADCYIHMGDYGNAQEAIGKAKRIDENNVYVLLLEALLLQKQGKAEEAICLLKNCPMTEQPEQILFRMGRAYDQEGDSEEANRCYIEALSKNPKSYDAMLCHLNHLIFSDSDSAGQKIESLKKVLRGKRRAILMNIEARYIGYANGDEEAAIHLLKDVKPQFRDLQWYAVNAQLHEKQIEKCRRKDLLVVANQYERDLDKIKKEAEERFNKKVFNNVDFLPDA